MAFSTQTATDLWRYPLVVLPGFMSDGRVWEQQVRLLSQHVPVIVAPVRGADRVEEVAANLLPQLPQRFTVVGAGLGGSVAISLLQQASERVAGIGLVASSPLAETPAKAAEREPWIIKARAGRLRAVMQDVFPVTTLAPGPLRAQVMAQIAEMAEELGPDLFVQQSRMLQRRSDMQAVLRRAAQPGLVICGVHDNLVPVKRQLFTAELMQHTRIEMIEDAGHRPLLEQPARVSAILYDWIMQGAQTKGAAVDQQQAKPAPLRVPETIQQIAEGRPAGKRRFSRPPFEMIGDFSEETEEQGSVAPELNEGEFEARFASVRRSRRAAEGPIRRVS